MGEYYWGEAKIALPEPLPLNINDDDFDVEVWVDNHLVEKFGTLEGLDPVKQAEYDGEYERLTELLWEIAGWFEGAEVVEVDEDTRTITIGGQHDYGIAFWTENTSLEETCQTNGIAYELSDEGKYENPGENRMWKPTMAEGPVVRGNSQDGVVLPLSEADGLYTQANGDDAKFGRLVWHYFHPEGS